MSKEAVFAVLILAALYFCYVLFSDNSYKQHQPTTVSKVSPPTEKTDTSFHIQQPEVPNKQFLGFSSPTSAHDYAEEAVVNPINVIVDQDIQSILASSQNDLVSNTETVQAKAKEETQATQKAEIKPKLELNLTFEVNASSLSGRLEIIQKDLINKVQSSNDTFANYSLQILNQTLLKDIVQYIAEKEPEGSDVIRVLARNANPFRELQLYNDILTPKELGKKNDVIGIARDPLYCDLVDMLNIQSSANSKKKRYYYTDYPYKMFNKYLDEENPIFTTKEFTTLLEQKTYKHLDYPLSEFTTLFFHKRPDFKYIRELGMDHLCFTQAYGNIAGLNVLTSKSHLMELSKNYAQRYKNRPECYKRDEFIPVAYFLNDKDDCKAFFKLINSLEYKKSKKKNNPIQFTMTIETGEDQTSSYLLTDETEEILFKDYDDGELCGINKNVSIAQMEIFKPLLINETSSFDFRVYLLIASTNPLIVFYHDGFAIITNSSSASKNSSETTEENSENLQLLTMEAFQDELIKIKQISDNNWLNDTLRPKFKTAIAHLIRMGEVNLTKRSGNFRLMGLDFKMDMKNKVWLTRVTADPQFYNSNREIWERNEKMIADMFDIVYALLKSRIKQLSALMKDFTADYLIPKKNYELITFQSLFYSKNSDSFDKTHMYEEGNSWQPVIDMTKPSSSAYHGLIPQTCL